MFKSDSVKVVRAYQHAVALYDYQIQKQKQKQHVFEHGLDLRTPAFPHGQLYVAISRVTNANLIGLPSVSDNTLRRAFVKEGYHRRAARKKPLLSQKQKEKRMNAISGREKPEARLMLLVLRMRDYMRIVFPIFQRIPS